MGKKPINILLIKTINTATYSFVSLIHIKLKFAADLQKINPNLINTLKA